MRVNEKLAPLFTLYHLWGPSRVCVQAGPALRLWMKYVFKQKKSAHPARLHILVYVFHPAFLFDT